MDTKRPAAISRRVALAGLGATGLGLALSTMTVGSIAQEVTPPGGSGIAVGEMAPGVTRELFAGVPSARAEGHTLYQARFTFQPGAEIFPHSHPGSVLLAVSSGAFGWTLVSGVAHVLRGAAAGATDPPEDLTEPGTDVILDPGDAIFYEDDVVHTARGAGSGPAIVLGTFLLTAGEPSAMLAGTEVNESDSSTTGGGGVNTGSPNVYETP